MADMRIRLTVTGVLFGLVLAGCGFEPRGELDLPGAVRVNGGSYALRNAVETRLAASGARLSRNDADIVLTLEPGGFDERVLSIDPVRGEAHEYQVSFHVAYSMRDGSGKRILEPGEVSVLREYRVHRGERSSRYRERKVVRDEMRREAAAAIIRRLYADTGG